MSLTELNYFYVQYPINKERFIASSVGKDLRKGDMVVVDNIAFGDMIIGSDILTIIDEVRDKSLCENQTVFKINRIATKEDFDILNKKSEKEKSVLNEMNALVNQEKLDMKIHKIHIMPFSNSFIVFYTAETRVDFRNLVKLSSEKINIHPIMRQIDERECSRFFSCCGPCGKVLCCEKAPNCLKGLKKNGVTMKSLKDQNIFLTVDKYTGCCGKLMCCMNFEVDFYREEKEKYPKVGDTIYVDDAQWTVKDINYIKSMMKIESSDKSMSEYIDNSSVFLSNNKWYKKD